MHTQKQNHSNLSSLIGAEGQQEPVEQIDLVPTLSLLLGLPIPQNSLGRGITPLLEHSLSMRDLLRALQLNCHQLSLVLQENVEAPRTGTYT